MNKILKRNIFSTLLISVIVALLGIVTLRMYVNDKVYAGGLAPNTFYVNAPLVVVNGQSDKNTATITSSQPLFTSNGVNQETLLSLMTIINDSNILTKKLPTQEGQLQFYSAEDFGRYGNQSNWTDKQKGNAQIVIQLFEARFGPYWQAVYRSTSSTADVLTLYATHDTGSIFPHTNNYSQLEYTTNDTTVGTLRSALLSKYNELTTQHSELDKYVVAPYQLSSYGADDLSNTSLSAEQNQVDKFFNLGAWQSSAVQTGSTVSATNTSIGSSPNSSGGGDFAYNNGMDGLSVTPFSNNASTYTDKLWEPSAFEVFYTGYGDSSVVDYDNINAISTTENSSDLTIYENMLVNANNDSSRTGLWKLNAYDRATGVWAWLRSALYNDSQYRVIHNNGSWHQYQASDPTYSRAAIHIDLKALSQLITKTVNVNVTSGANIDPTTSGGITQYDINGMDYTEQGKYLGKLFENDDSSKGTMIVKYNYDTLKYNVLNFSINGQVINAETFSGNGSINGVCDYSYYKNTVGIEIALSNVESDITVSAQAEEFSNYGLTLQLNNNATNNYMIILSSDGNAYAYNVTTQGGSITLSFPMLIINREYKLTILGSAKFTNVENSSAELQVDFEDNNSITFICATPNITATISGITITNY